MHLGVHIVNFTLPGAPASLPAILGGIAEASEAVGLRHLSLMDHYLQLDMMGDPAHAMLEGYSTLGFLAAKTSTVSLGLLVTGVTYRHPGLLAKIISTLDVLTGGRAFLGIGAGWYEREHKAFGVPFPAIRERLERLDETLQICLQMWSDDNGPFEGKHFHLAETLNSPQTIQRPHPPILVGGAGEKVLLRLVARYADACNLFSQIGLDGAKHKLEVLRGHCDNEKRDYDAIRKTLLWGGPAPVGESLDEFLQQADAYAKLGFEEIIVMPFVEDPVGWIHQLAPAVERLRDIG